MIFEFDDTIAAIATPLGEGGLAIVRLSGAGALAVADKCFNPVGKSSLTPSTAATHTIHYGKIMRRGQVIDEVLLAVMRAPRTYTREDTVEINCHGGLLPAKLVLDTVLENGARLAQPGEFTQRAFLNGRLDLTQAEAVVDVIRSQTELALAAANEQLAGKLSQRINQLRDEMMTTLAHIEAHIDFPDEDIAPDTKDQLLARLERGVGFMDELLRTASEGQILRRGIRAAIVGRPNAGKSSLLNQLLGHDRAIVSTVPGTTRDTIEETANLRGIPVVFIDTAGLRETTDEVESEGVQRSRAALAKAELILHVLDTSEPLTPADETYLAEFVGKKRILIRNKIDLPTKLVLPRGIVEATCISDTDESERAAGILRAKCSRSAGERPAAHVESIHGPNEHPTMEVEASLKRDRSPIPIIDVCCLTGTGIEPLKDTIKGLIWSGEIKADMGQVMINARHQDALRRAREATVLTIDALGADLSLEFVALDLRIAVNAVGEIVGKTATEDLLDSIFSQFCIGK